jgi:hypothetical protein
MDVWDKEELLECWKLLHTNHLSEEQLLQNYTEQGGVARKAFTPGSKLELLFSRLGAKEWLQLERLPLLALWDLVPLSLAHIRVRCSSTPRWGMLHTVHVHA